MQKSCKLTICKEFIDDIVVIINSILINAFVNASTCNYSILLFRWSQKKNWKRFCPIKAKARYRIREELPGEWLIHEARLYLVSMIGISCYVSIRVVQYLIWKLQTRKYQTMKWKRSYIYIYIMQEELRKTWIHVSELIPHAGAFPIFICSSFILERGTNYQ